MHTLSAPAAMAPRPTMIEAANFAKTIARRLIGEIHGLTVDEIELDENSHEWVVAVSFWLPTPAPKRGLAIISPTPIRREARVLRIGTQKPPRLISMKAKLSVSTGGNE
jgi:hypothetical protein